MCIILVYYNFNLSKLKHSFDDDDTTMCTTYLSSDRRIDVKGLLR
jgi:hypothetical protein